MSWMTCDVCRKSNYTTDNPMVEYRQQRPSDKSDMCCTMAGHMKCLGTNNIANLKASEYGGNATRQQWNDWIESKEAMKAGFLFLS